MRVLHVLPDLSTRSGGIPVFVVEAARALDHAGVGVSVVATDLDSPTSARDKGRAGAGDLVAGTELVDHALFRADFPRRLAHSRELGRHLRAHAGDYDLVHEHSLYLWPLRQVHDACRRAGTPYVVSPHGALDPFLRARHRPRKAAVDALWQRRALRDASAIHVTTEDERRLGADVAPAVRRSIVPPGIWWEQFQSPADGEAFRRAHLDGFDGPLVLSLGRVTFKKALDVLIGSLADGRSSLNDVRLAIVGPDDEELTPRLRAMAEHAGIADRVVFTGPIYGDERLDALAAGTVWALPSYAENFGIAAVEAMAAGRPVLISDRVNLAPDAAAAGAAEVVEASATSVADGLERLLSDPGHRHAIADRGRTFSRAYDWPAVAGRLTDMYRTVAAS
jgi:glycosyltransferase involved in cell wall biosynthesis